MSHDTSCQEGDFQALPQKRTQQVFSVSSMACEGFESEQGQGSSGASPATVHPQVLITQAHKSSSP